MNEKERKELAEILGKLNSIILDLGELENLADLPYQLKQLRRAAKDIVPLIHGSGTGRD